MYDLFGYLKKYGDVSFLEKEFNVVDSFILTAITYVDYTNIIGKKKVNLHYAINRFLETVDFKHFIRSGFFYKDVIKLMKVLSTSKRYGEILAYNYEYKLTFEEQFGAITFKLPDGSVFVSFLGSDDTIVAWHEDFNMIHRFPVPAQKDAVKYLNKTVSIFDNKVYVGGHSKGGNLALVASMYCNFIVKGKIEQIYNLDGPGLRYKEINSNKYKSIEDRYSHIVPNNSFVGLLLRHTDKYIVVKSNKLTIESHSMFTWMIDDDKLHEVTLSSVSKKLDMSINIWLNEHNDKTRKEIIDNVFDIIYASGIVNTKDFLNLKKIYNIVKNIKDIDAGTRSLLIDFFKFNLGYVVDRKKD
jgi:hypothetical protein